jgi:hypothetical protein
MTEPIVYDRPAPDWLYVGAPVVTMRRWSGRTTGVARTEVAKLTKRDIVLADGQRFRHDSQSTRFGGDEVYYMRSNHSYEYTYLHAPDSKAVANHKAAQEEEKLKNRVFQAARDLSGGCVDRERIDAMAAVIDEWRAAAHPENADDAGGATRDYDSLYRAIQAGVEHVIDGQDEWKKLTRAELVDKMMTMHRAGLNPRISELVVRLASTPEEV